MGAEQPVVVEQLDDVIWGNRIGDKQTDYGRQSQSTGRNPTDFEVIVTA
jgi:hypothetical protein